MQPLPATPLDQHLCGLIRIVRSCDSPLLLSVDREPHDVVCGLLVLALLDLPDPTLGCNVGAKIKINLQIPFIYAASCLWIRPFQRLNTDSIPVSGTNFLCGRSALLVHAILTKFQKTKRRCALALRGAATAVPEKSPAKFRTFT